jgi:hypothetical protein
MSTKYTVEQIETGGTQCKFHSMGAERDGWILPDGVGVDYAGYTQLSFEPETITTADVEGLRRARAAVANAQLVAMGYAKPEVVASAWTTHGNAWLKVVQGSAPKDTAFQTIYVVFNEQSAQLVSATIEPYNTSNPGALHLARLDQANSQFSNQEPYGKPLTEHQGWLVAGNEWVQAGYAEHAGQRMLIEVRILFRPGTPALISVSSFNITCALSNDAEWTPSYKEWRHGGWYVTNLSYPSGACGCVSNNYHDKRWRIVTDCRRDILGQPGDYHFATRDEAAQAERALVRDLTLQTLERRPWKALVAGA